MKPTTAQMALSTLKLCHRELAAWMIDHGEDISSLQALADSSVAIAALEADIARVVDVPPCWYCDFGGYGRITMQQNEADAALANGANVTQYVAAPQEAAAPEPVNAGLLAALHLFLERVEEPPEPRCSCHLSPPCNDCIDYGGLREAFECANAAIAKATGGEA